jgi:LysM repeat protein
MADRFITLKKLLIAIPAVVFFVIACAQINSLNRPMASTPDLLTPEIVKPTITVLPSATLPDVVFITPTPDPPKPLPTLRADVEGYIVQSGDTLNVIARQFGISVYAISLANELENPNLIEVGQVSGNSPT